MGGAVMSRQREDKLSLYHHARSGEYAWRKRGSDEWKEVPFVFDTLIDKLEVHPLTKDMFPEIKDTAFDELVADIGANGLRERIALYQGKIVDGWNRYRALLKLGHADRPEFYCNVLHLIGPTTERITDELVKTYVLSKNWHRRHMTADERREFIATKLRADPEKSDRQIAKETGSNRTTVGEVRQDMEDRGEVSIPDTRTDAKGVKQPAKKKGKKKLTKAQRKEAAERRRAAQQAKKKHRYEAIRAQLPNDIDDLLDEVDNARDEFVAHTISIWEDRAEEVVDHAKAEEYARVAATVWARLAEEVRQKAAAAGNDVDPEASADDRKREMAALDGAEGGR
jgi:hypothetical protein